MTIRKDEHHILNREKGATNTVESLSKQYGFKGIFLMPVNLYGP